MPEEIDLARLQIPPTYSKEFAALTEEILGHSTEARYLVLATEREQFGAQADDKLSRLRAAANNGGRVAAYLKGFVVRAFSIPSGLADPVHDDLTSAYASSRPVQRKLRTGTAIP